MLSVVFRPDPSRWPLSFLFCNVVLLLITGFLLLDNYVRSRSKINLFLYVASIVLAFSRLFSTLYVARNPTFGTSGAYVFVYLGLGWIWGFTLALLIAPGIRRLGYSG